MTDTTTLNLSDIRTDGGTQSRAQINSETVRDYAEAMGRGDQFPPLTVFYDGEQHWLADGFHRYEAAADSGIAELDTRVMQGSQRDAILHSVAANVMHGLPRSHKDKRRAVDKLLQDEEWRAWSDREIAERIKTSHTFVAKMRAATGNVSSTRTYKRDGETRTMDTAKIADANAARALPLDDLKEQIFQAIHEQGFIKYDLLYRLFPARKFDKKLVRRAIGDLEGQGRIVDSINGYQVTPSVSSAARATTDNSDPKTAEITRVPIGAEITENDILDLLKDGPKHLGELIDYLKANKPQKGDKLGYIVANRVSILLGQLQESGQIVYTGGAGTGQRGAYSLPDPDPDGHPVKLSHARHAILTSLEHGAAQGEDLRQAIMMDRPSFDAAIAALLESSSINNIGDDATPVYKLASMAHPKFTKATPARTRPPMSLDTAKEHAIDVFRAKRSLSRPIYPGEIVRWANVIGFDLPIAKQALAALADNPLSGIRAVQTPTGLAYADFDTTITPPSDVAAQLDGIEQGIEAIFKQMQSIDSIEFTAALIQKDGVSRAKLGRIRQALTYTSNELGRFDVICHQAQQAAELKSAANDEIASDMTAAFEQKRVDLQPAVNQIAGEATA